MACQGRLQKIFDRVRELFNEGSATGSGSGFLQDEALMLWCNECTSELALDGVWTKTAAIEVTAGTSGYDLSALLSDLVQVHEVRHTAGGYRLDCCTNRTELADISATYESGTPRAYYVHGDALELAPVLSVTEADGLTVFYSYYPGDLDCTTNYTPRIPEAFDDVYTYYCLWAAYQKDRTNPTSGRNTPYYWDLFRRKKSQLLGSRLSPKGGVRPYR